MTGSEGLDPVLVAWNSSGREHSDVEIAGLGGGLCSA